MRVKHLSRLTLTWLSNHAEEFRVASYGTYSVLSHVKPLTELMLLLVVLAKHQIRDGQVSVLAERAVAHGRQFDWHELFSHDASGATVLGTIAEFFASNQLPPPFEVEFCRFLHSSGFLEGMDRVAYREMDLAHCLMWLVSPDFVGELPGWFASTAFGRRQHLTRYTIDDLYSLTHAAFYLTSFGTRNLGEVLDDSTAERLRIELAALTAIVLRSDNIDVLGELLLCWLFCDVEDTPLNRLLFRQAFARVMSATMPSGQVVPGLRLLPRAEAGETTFDDVYHTTLVAGMLFALAAKDAARYVS
ncbi:MAG: hypothetical protein M3P29_07705 [Acidobacteriota bacterium]|nr:hypothetical protein [Acidobacteriota bacterium]